MYTFQTVFMCTCVRYVCVEGGGLHPVCIITEWFREGYYLNTTYAL